MNSASPLYPSSVFKAYDIRGVVPDALNPAFAEALGLAFGARALALGERSVAVGRDGRLSSPLLAEALSRGLARAGVDVLDVGMVTTPMLYFAAHTLCRSGIQVTGSHNPKHHNGFKMVLAGRAIYGDDIQALRLAMERAEAPQVPPGQVQAVPVVDDYIARIVGDVKLQRPLRIVVDSGNGVAGASAPGLFRALGCEVIELFSEVDGNFPHHHPDPSKPENLRDLMATLQATGADLGLAFDGDGDRLGIVTPSGQNIYPDRQMQLFAQDVLSRVPGGTIVFDVKCSQRLAPAIRACGGVPLMYKTGHSLIKARMKEVDSPLGGEMSGHIFFKERWFGFDDGSYAGARLLEILSRHANPGAVLEGLPTSFPPRAERGLRRRRAAPPGGRAAGNGPLRCAGPGQHHRRPARRLAGRLWPDPRVQHHAGAGAALRGADARGAGPHSGRDDGAAAAVKPDLFRGWGRRRIDGLLANLLLWLLLALLVFGRALWRPASVAPAATLPPPWVKPLLWRYLGWVALLLLGMVFVGDASHFKARWLHPLLLMVPLLAFVARPEFEQHPRGQWFTSAVLLGFLLFGTLVAARPWLNGRLDRLNEINEPIVELSRQLQQAGYDGRSPIVASDPVLGGMLRSRFPQARVTVCSVSDLAAATACMQGARQAGAALSAAQPMLLVARQVEPGADWWRAAAADLPLPAVQTLQLPYLYASAKARPVRYQFLWPSLSGPG
jgi:phosphomannomutase